MKLELAIKKQIYNILQTRRHRKMIEAEYRKFEDPRRIAIFSSVHLSPNQEKQIDEVFLTHYGKKVPYTWHRHFTAYTGNFDPYYIPEPLYIPEFEYFMNSKREYISVYANKNVLSMISNGVGVRMPETIVSCANGILRDSQYRIISWGEVEDLLPDSISFVKPTVDSDSGKGCMLLDKSQENCIPSLKARVSTDFVVQERILCSNSIREIYPESVNTFRIMTYIWDGKICCAPVIMRIGRNGSFLDNAHAGGIFIAVNKDGTLHKTAFTEFKDEFEEHPDTHLVFEGYKVQNFNRVLESAVKMHTAIPQLGVINWDYTIDKDEQPVLIEANTSGGSIWLFQMAWGCGVFEDNTIAVLEWLRKKNRK